MKAINFFLVYCDKLTLLPRICDTHEMNIQRQTRLYRTYYISKYLLRSLGLRYIRVLLYIHPILRSNNGEMLPHITVVLIDVGML